MNKLIIKHNELTAEEFVLFVGSSGVGAGTIIGADKAGHGAGCLFLMVIRSLVWPE